jgi:predicted anti-sigma-YlaC factor YlaD
MSRACDTAREIVSAGLDGEATTIDRKRAQRHVERCSDCRAFAAAAERMTDALRAAPPLPAPALVPPAPARSGARRGRLIVRAAGVAAAFAAAAGVGASVSGGGRQEPAATPARAPVLVLAALDRDRAQHAELRLREGRGPESSYRVGRLETLTLG